MGDLAFYGLIALALCVGALISRLFPRLGIVLGWVILAGTGIALLGIARELVTIFGVFWGLLIAAVVAILAMVPTAIAVGLLGMGKHVLQAEEAARQDPVAIAADYSAGPELTPDIEAYIRSDYAATQVEEARSILERARIRGGERAGTRLVRCALVASTGDIEGLREQVRLMRDDHKALILRAECEADAAGQLVRVRDLGLPFDAGGSEPSPGSR